MQKTEFVRVVAERANTSQKEARHIIDTALAVIVESLAAGNRVTLTGFGTFEVRSRRSREGVNPRSAAKITIPATRTPGFSASSTMKAAVKQSTDASESEH